MSEISQDASTQQSSDAHPFSNENSWMVQCLSLAALGMMTYLHLAPMIQVGVT